MNAMTHFLALFAVRCSPVRPFHRLCSFMGRGFFPITFPGTAILKTGRLREITPHFPRLRAPTNSK